MAGVQRVQGAAAARRHRRRRLRLRFRSRLHAERVTGDHAQHECLRTGSPDFAAACTIARTCGMSKYSQLATQPVHHQLLGEGLHELLRATQQRLAQLDGAVDRHAARQHRAGIDGLIRRRSTSRHGPVTSEVLHRQAESDRSRHGSGCRRRRAMLLEPRAHRRRLLAGLLRRDRCSRPAAAAWAACP